MWQSTCYDRACMAKKITKDQRGRVAEKVMEWGNLVFVGLVIAQFVPGTEHIQLGIIFAGLVSIITAYIFAYKILKGGG